MTADTAPDSAGIVRRRMARPAWPADRVPPPGGAAAIVGPFRVPSGRVDTRLQPFGSSRGEAIGAESGSVAPRSDGPEFPWFPVQLQPDHGRI
ncbi:MAG: hypothetical protein D6725_11175 [Planctomycetota bacterium]|nr:MAG: hypothetical protein D6725_11175 [Planctomycetota bacterium]